MWKSDQTFSLLIQKKKKKVEIFFTWGEGIEKEKVTLEAERRGEGWVVGKRRWFSRGVLGKVEREERKWEETRKENEDVEGRTRYPDGAFDYNAHFDLRRRNPRSVRNVFGLLKTDKWGRKRRFNLLEFEKRAVLPSRGCFKTVRFDLINNIFSLKY